MTHTTELTLTQATDLLDAPRQERLETLTEKRGAWYTFADGEKKRGAEAADTRAYALLATYVQDIIAGEREQVAAIQAEEATNPQTPGYGEDDDEPTTPVRHEDDDEEITPTPDADYPSDMKKVLEEYKDGAIFYPLSHWPTATKKQFNPKQPATIFTCSCGTRRIVHLQDVKQTAGRCVKCVRRERRVRAKQQKAHKEG